MTNCYISGIHGSSIGDRSLNVKVDSNGKLFTSVNARPCAKISRFTSASAIVLTPTAIEFAPTGGVFELFADTSVFSMSANGRIKYNGLYFGDSTARRFRVSFTMNYLPTGTGTYAITYAINGILSSEKTELNNTGATSRSIIVAEEFISLSPNNYVSTFFSASANNNLTYTKYSFFIELLK